MELIWIEVFLKSFPTWFNANLSNSWPSTYLHSDIFYSFLHQAVDSSINVSGATVVPFFRKRNLIKRRVKDKLHLEKVSGSRPVMNDANGLNVEKVLATNLGICFFQYCTCFLCVKVVLFR